MPAVQTFLRNREYEKFKRYMEKRGLTVYKAGAELITLGLQKVGGIQEGIDRTDEEAHVIRMSHLNHIIHIKEMEQRTSFRAYAKWLAELEHEAEEKLEDLKKRLKGKAIELQGKKPLGLKTAMIYLLAGKRGITQSQLAEIHGITTPVLQTKVKLLKRLMQDSGVKLE